MHQEIREGEKETGVGAHLRLGRPLSITLLADRRVEEYEDLDEVLARFAEPLAANIKAVRAHRCAPRSPMASSEYTLCAPAVSPAC